MTEASEARLKQKFQAMGPAGDIDARVPFIWGGSRHRKLVEPYNESVSQWARENCDEGPANLNNDARMQQK